MRRQLGLLRIALEAVGTSRLARDQSAPARAGRLQAACAEIAQTHGLRLNVRGRLPFGPAVIVANHASYLDIIAIATLAPCAPIAKAEVASWPVIGGATRGLGAIFVERASMWSRAKALRTALATLRTGTSVLTFPEGTTTDGTRLLPFARGMFGIARIANVPVVPIAIRCDADVAWHGGAPFLPHYWRTCRRDPEITLDIGRPLDASQFASADEVAVIARHRIAHALRGHEEIVHAAARSRVPAPRPDPVLSVVTG